MSKPRRKSTSTHEATSRAARAAAQSERSRLALQRASSVKPPRVATPDDEPVGKGRKGRKGVVIYLTPEAKEQLARLAHDQRKSVQSIGTDAINLLFEAHRLKPIA